MSTYLAPVASSSKLPESPSLALLPFALGSSNNAYKTSTAPINQYFQPRPCPANITGIPEGTPIASFRGRQLVGHTIQLPPGYRGLVIKAPEPHTVETKWPLTPAPSVASTSTFADPSAMPTSRRSPRKSTLANVANTIKSKVRGAGQVALSRPKTRQAKTGTIKRKRYQIDSDEEDEERHIELFRAVEVETPRKRTRSGATALDEDVPMIVVQEATPLKEPLPTPKKRLGTASAKERLPGASRRSPSPSPSIETTEGSQTSEAVIPSPATENDPPFFVVKDVKPPTSDAPVAAKAKTCQGENNQDLPAPAPSTEFIKTEVEIQETTDEEYSNARVLRPASTFDSFTLWTPDGILPGFKQDEHAEDEVKELEAETEADTEGGIKLRKGWWRTGGAGEGGDEIVRALGEWIGLVEEVSPVMKRQDDADDPAQQTRLP
jgi:hypothetical protein